MKKFVIASAVTAVTAVCGVAAVRAVTAPKYGSVRGVVALVGDSNIVLGATSISGKMTASEIGYVPVILSAGGYSASSDFVVWAFSAPGADNRVYLYQISSGKATPISPDAAGSPSIFINSAFVVWATDPFLDKDPGNTWSVQAYDIARGEIKTVAAGIAAQSQRTALLIGNHAGRRHLLSGKSAKRRRRLRDAKVMHHTDEYKIKQSLPFTR